MVIPLDYSFSWGCHLTLTKRKESLDIIKTWLSRLELTRENKFKLGSIQF